MQICDICKEPIERYQSFALSPDLDVCQGCYKNAVDSVKPYKEVSKMNYNQESMYEAKCASPYMENAKKTVLARADTDRDRVFKQLISTHALAQDILSLANDRLSAYRKPQPECGQDSQGPCRDMAPVWGDFSEKLASVQAALHMIGATIREAEL